MRGLAGFIGWVRQPAYTGDNRCLPCTILNGIITVVLAVVLGWVWVPAGVTMLVLGVAAITLRGYLIPGTPTLTRRYLPPRVAAWFGKDEPDRSIPAPVDMGKFLVEKGIIEPGQADLRLTDTFGETVSSMADRTSDPSLEEVASLFDATSKELSVITEDPPQFDVAGIHYRWPSEAGLVVDLALDAALETHVDHWSDYGTNFRVSVIETLRPFITECPVCGGPVELTPDAGASPETETLAGACACCERQVYALDADIIN